MQHTSVDGVTCFWVDTGRPTLTARLMFRVGSVDEPLNQTGWLHLLEHSVLHDRGGGALHVNGSVSPLMTAFDAHGPAEAVAQHLSEVASALRAPDPERLIREKDVLRAEGDLRGGPAIRAFSWRYGARGPGVVAMGEPGLGRADAPALVELAHRVFTRGNAALVLDGPPPPTLRLDLPDGDLMAIPRAHPCTQKVPAWYVDDSLVLSGVVTRSKGATILPEILERGLRVRLRDQAAGSYAPWCTYEPVDGERALVIAGADAARSLMPTLAYEARMLVHETAADGPDPEWLMDVKTMRRQAILDPYALIGVAMRAAHDHLRGRPILSQDEMVEELESTTVEDVQASAQEFARSLMLGLPGDAIAPTDIPSIEQPIERGVVTGHRFRRIDWPAATSSLVVDAEDAHLLEGEQYRCFHARDIAAMLCWEDGGRHLITFDGWGMTVEPTHWRNGRRAVELLDAMVPGPRRLPMPPREPVQPPTIPNIAARWWKAVQRPWSPLALVITALSITILTLVLLTTGNPSSGLGIVVFSVSWLLWAAWKRHQARTYRGREAPRGQLIQH